MTAPQVTQGFTLVEMLVSLFILCIVGLMTAASLNFIVRSADHIEKDLKMLGSLQRTVMTIEQDLRQVRLPALPSGVPAWPAIIASDTYVQLTTAPFSNPGEKLGKNNSLKQIIYQTVNGRLIRYEKLPGKNMTHGVLLERVRSVHFKMIPSENPLSDPYPASLQNRIIFTGMILDIQTEKNGSIRRIIPLAVNATDTDPGDNPRPV